MVWCITYAKKIINKRIDPRARSRFENGTDPNPYITALFPKWVGVVLVQHVGGSDEVRRYADVLEYVPHVLVIEAGEGG